MSGTIETVEIANNGGNELTICLPGILTRSSSLYRPVAPSLPGMVIGFDDATTHHDHFDLEYAVVRIATQHLAAGTPVNLVGTSMGGMKVPFVVDALPVELRQRLGKIAIVDAPNGAKTMKPIPPLTAGILKSRLMGRLFRTQLGDQIVAALTQPPKESEISIPERSERARLLDIDEDWLMIDDKTLMRDAWIAYVGMQSRLDLSGFAGSLWWSWLRWMIEVGNNGSLSSVCSSLYDLDVTYVACTHPGNGVVAQPQAAEWWYRSVPGGLKVIEAPIVHAGYLQQQRESIAVFRAIFG